MTAVSLKLVFSKSDTRRVSLRGPSQSMFDQLIDHVKAILIAKSESSEFSLLHAGDGNVVQRITSPEQLMRAIQAAETTGKHLKLTVDLPHSVNAPPSIPVPTPAPPVMVTAATAPASPMLQPMPPSTPPLPPLPLSSSVATARGTVTPHPHHNVISAPSQSPHLHTTLSMGHIPSSSSIPIPSWTTTGHSASVPYTHIPSSPAGHPPIHPHPPLHHTPQRSPMPPLTWPPMPPSVLPPTINGSGHPSPAPSPSSSTATPVMWSMSQSSHPTNRATVVISSPVSSWNYSATAPPVVVAAPVNVTQPTSYPSTQAIDRSQPTTDTSGIKLGTESQSTYHAHMLTWLPVTTDERHCDVCIGDLGTRAWQCTTGACDFHICASCRAREPSTAAPSLPVPVPVMATPAVNPPTRVAMATAVPTTPAPAAVAVPPIPVTPAMVVISMPQSAPTPQPQPPVVNPTPTPTPSTTSSSSSSSTSSSSSSSSAPVPTPGVPSSRNHRGSITEEQRPRLNLSPEDEARELLSIRRDLAAVLGEVAQPSVTHLDNTSPFDEVCLKHIRRNLNTFEDYYLGMCKDFSGRQSRCKMMYTERLQAIKVKYERVVMGEPLTDDSKDGKEIKADSKDSKESKAKKPATTSTTTATATTEGKRITPITVSSVAMEWKECREEYARELERINTRFQRRVDVLVARYDKHMQDMAANSFLLPISLTLSIAHRPISFEVMMGSTDTLGDVRELLEEKMRELGDPIENYSPATRWAISTPVSTATAIASQPRSGTAGVVNAVVNSIHGAAVSVANPSSSAPTPTPASSPPAAASSSSIWSLFGGGGNAPVEQPKSPVASPQPSPDEPSGRDGSRSPTMTKRSIASSPSAASSALSVPVAPTAATSGFGRFLGSLAAVGKTGLQTVGKKIAEQTEIKPEPRVFVVDGRDDFLSLSELRITAKSTITLLGGVRLQSEAPLCVMYRTHALLQAASSDHFVCVQCDLKYICAQCVISCHQGHQVAIVDEGADAAASSAGGAKKSGAIDKKSVALASGSAAAASSSSSAPQPSTKKVQCDCGIPRPPQMARHPLHPHPCRRVVRSVTAEPQSPWLCDGCGKEGDDIAGRFRCVEGCQNFDLCLACWSSEVPEPPPHICSFAPKPKRNNPPPLPTTAPTGNGIAPKKLLAPPISIGGEDQIEGSGEVPSASPSSAAGDALPSSNPVAKRRPSVGPRPPATPPVGAVPHGSPHHSGNSGPHDHIPPMALPSASPTGAHVVVHHNVYPGQAHVLITPSASATPAASGGGNYDGALKQLAEMGFNDSALNLRYLRQKNGNVDAVLQLLLTLPNT